MNPSRLRIAASLMLLALCASGRATALDGAPDPKFNGNGRAVIDVGADPLLRAVAAQPDGKIVTVGSARRPTPEDWSNTAFVVARWNPDGTPDTTFGPLQTGVVDVELDFGGVGLQSDGATSVVIQPDGYIVVAGVAQLTPTQMVAVVARLAPDGDLDATFGGGDGKADFPELGFTSRCSLLLRRDGKILLTPTTVGGNVLLQLTSDGFRDVTWGFGGQTEPWDCGSPACGWFLDTVELPDGSLLSLGETQAGDAVVLAHFLGENGGPGELDTSFGIGGIASFSHPGFADVNVLGMALDHEARALVLVRDTSVFSHTGLLRVRGDQPDPTFGTGGWSELTFTPPSATATGYAAALMVQSDGKPVIAGNARMNGSIDFAIARLTADGIAIDTSFSGGWRTIGFDVGGGLTDHPYAMTSSAGRPLVAGLANTASGQLFAVARLDNALLWTDGFESGSTWFWETSP